MPQLGLLFCGVVLALKHGSDTVLRVGRDCGKKENIVTVFYLTSIDILHSSEMWQNLNSKIWATFSGNRILSLSVLCYLIYTFSKVAEVFVETLRFLSVPLAIISGVGTLINSPLGLFSAIILTAIVFYKGLSGCAVLLTEEDSNSTSLRIILTIVSISTTIGIFKLQGSSLQRIVIGSVGIFGSISLLLGIVYYSFNYTNWGEVNLILPRNYRVSPVTGANSPIFEASEWVFTVSGFCTFFGVLIATVWKLSPLPEVLFVLTWIGSAEIFSSQGLIDNTLDIEKLITKPLIVFSSNLYR
jgi:hypothetical protein